MEEKNRYVPLRPEARPVDYSKLDASQRYAFRRVVGMLAGALQEIGTSNERKRTTAGQGLRAPPAWLDHDLASRMAFLYGDRGTGKSTVLMSLIKLCSSAQERRQEEEPGAEIPAPTRYSLSTLHGRVVWLEPIDMARFPGSANLLAAVLARIEDAARPFVFPATAERGGRGAGREPLGVLGGYPEGLDPLLTLQRLQTAVAIAWEGNLPEHGGQLDPDSYAVEVMRAERERMTFKVKLSEALDALAAVVPGTGAGGPLFVVALDDVDLNPLRCLETLKLLHLLAVPRVFTIVLGDMDMVEIVLNLKHSGDFSALVGHRARLNPLSMPRRDIAAAVGRLSANAMRKLLPPAQRIRLRSMTRADALNLLPIGTDSGRLPRLHALLHRCPAAIATDDPPRMGETDIYSLRDFLLYGRDKKDKRRTDETEIADEEIADEELETCTYAASQILSMPPRWGTDWWLVLKDVDDRHPCRPESEERPNDKWCTPDERDKKWKEVIDLLARHCRSVIDEDPTLTPLDRRSFREGWRRSPSSDTWELSVPVRSTPEMGPRSFFSVSDRDPLYPFARGILLRPGHGWRLQPGRSALRPPTTVEPEQPDGDMRRLEASFATETTWALIFLHDLLNLGPGWNLARRSLSIYWPPELWGISAWAIPPRQHVWVAWPTPSVLSFWEFDVFLSHWNAALKYIVETRSPEGEQASIEACVYAWLDAGAAVLSRQKPLWPPEGYDLRLMSVAATDRLVNEGRNLVIVALVGTDLHIRIFDVSGKKVVDKAENELVSGETLTALKKQLTPIPDESGLSKEREQKIIGNATSIARHSLPENPGTPDYWKALVQRLADDVAKIASRLDPRGYAVAEWLGRLAHFLWPAVSGIQPETAIVFFEEDEGKNKLLTFWRKHLSAIDQHLDEIWEALNEKGVKDQGALKEYWNKYRDRIAGGRPPPAPPLS